MGQVPAMHITWQHLTTGPREARGRRAAAAAAHTYPCHYPHGRLSIVVTQHVLPLQGGQDQAASRAQWRHARVMCAPPRKPAPPLFGGPWAAARQQAHREHTPGTWRGAGRGARNGEMVALEQRDLSKAIGHALALWHGLMVGVRHLRRRAG